MRAKKHELVVESELNRVQIVREWITLKTSVRETINPVRAAKKIAQSAAAATGMFVTARRLFRRNGSSRRGAWLGNMISGAKIGMSLVSMLRERKRKA
ncbi:MAG TPA: hypothetical protein VFV23_14165 [Verrucomicrobiae bacterium]|nr:hypothetical protein [Verrucomicrobiae bacterium]